MEAWSAEGFPVFFADAPRVRVRDPLAEFLGAARDGVLEFGYADVVRLAGHSCPTVASAFLMARAALRALYRDALPERGGVRVELQDAAQNGVTGVIANVMALVTGATVDTGFKGIGGQFDRRGLLAYGADVQGQARFTRVDNRKAVTVSARLENVPSDPRVGLLMAKCAQDLATEEERTQFHQLWQDRVRRLLLEHADDPAVLQVAPA